MLASLDTLVSDVKVRRVLLRSGPFLHGHGCRLPAHVSLRWQARVYHLDASSTILSFCSVIMSCGGTDGQRFLCFQCDSCRLKQLWENSFYVSFVSPSLWDPGRDAPRMYRSGLVYLCFQGLGTAKGSWQVMKQRRRRDRWLQGVSNSFSCRILILRILYSSLKGKESPNFLPWRIYWNRVQLLHMVQLFLLSSPVSHKQCLENDYFKEQCNKYRARIVSSCAPACWFTLLPQSWNPPATFRTSWSFQTIFKGASM